MAINPFSAMGIEGIAQQIVAIGALGTAAFGLVDASKVVRSALPSSGFSVIEAALAPFAPALVQALGDTPGYDWKTLLKAHWINGRPKEEQKAIAVSLIQLGLTPETAPALAVPGRVSPEQLTEVVTALIGGAELSPQQLNLLGRFKAAIEARIDAGYERADQIYRNTARTAAGFVAVALAVAALLIMNNGIITTRQFGAAVLIGLVATPLAPIARDLASALTTAATALGRRVAG